MAKATSLTNHQQESFISTLKARFEKEGKRHKGIAWQDVLAKLEKDEKGLWSLMRMEETGGEPDVVRYDEKKKAFIFFDCAPESPSHRRSLCYDRTALDARKEHKPVNSAIDMAAEMGIEILTEEQYYYLQTLGAFDTKTSSWIATPEEMRSLGGALFSDLRFGRVFTYHNGASSYYAGRGFRGWIAI